MESKSVILSVLVMSLVMAQIQVEAKSCCSTTVSRNIYNTCRFAGGSRERCASLSGCKIVAGSSCPSYNLENSAEDVNEYCKVGCTSSVCGAMITLQSSDASGIVNGAVEKCANACSTFCTNGSKTALIEVA